VVGVWDFDDLESLDTGEVPWVAGVDWESVRDGDGGDHRVVGACRWFAAGPTKRRGDLPEAACRRRVEGERVEVGLCLLDMGLPGRPLRVGGSDERTDGQLGESDRRDERFAR